jgi:hypothetical protein
MKILTILFAICLFASCKKDDIDIATKNVFYEVAGPAKYRVRIVTDNMVIQTFDSVEVGWNWQRFVSVGSIVGMEATKLTMLDSNTIDFARIYIGLDFKRQVSDTGKLKTISIWEKIE